MIVPDEMFMIYFVYKNYKEVFCKSWKLENMAYVAN